MDFRIATSSLALTLTLLAACATRHGPGAPVTAFAETDPGGRAASTAHDIALWNGRETTLAGARTSAFMAVSSAAGLDIRDHDGTRLQVIRDRNLGDIDFAIMPTAESHFTVLGASDRGPDSGIALFRFDNVAGGELRHWGTVRSDVARPTGFCMRQRNGVVNAAVAGADGEVRLYAIAEGPEGAIDAREFRRFRLRSSVSGCAIDAAGGWLYLSEGRGGVWRYPLDGGEVSPQLVQAVDGVRLTAPVGGVAVLDDRGRYLIVSSRGDSSIALWRITGEPEWLGRFIVRQGPGGDEVTGTAGLDAYGGGFGALPGGVVALHDSVNDGGQNFKLVDWGEIRAALGLPGPAPPGAN